MENAKYVDKDGNPIELDELGRVKLAGIQLSNAVNSLKSKIQDHYKENGLKSPSKLRKLLENELGIDLTRFDEDDA